MKKCPSCNRTYQDDQLSFCLDDGSPLLSVGDTGQPSSYDSGATLQYNTSRETNPPPTQVYGSGQHPLPMQPPIQSPSWTQMPQATGTYGQPKKKSKAIYWILGGIAGLVVIGIAGVVLLVVIAGMSDSNTNNSNNTNLASNRNARSGNLNSSDSSNANANSGDTSAKDYQVQDDFSITTRWWSGANAYGKAQYVNGEYQLSAGSYGSYVVIYAPNQPPYNTANMTSRVIARSVTGTSPSQGYGLTVYGEMKNGNLEDYAFVIRTDESPAFRVALHQTGKETTLVNWTRSSLIRTGSSPNQIEVRAKDTQLSFYINGQYATSVTDSAGYKTGLVGFYSSDAVPVAFDDLEIYK